MATYYISPTGNDTTGTGTSGNPWLTLTKAITDSTSGDTIIFKSGTYTSLGSQVSMSSRTIRAETDYAAIVTQNFANLYMRVSDGYTVTFSGIKFLNCTTSSYGAPFYSAYSTAVLTVTNCKFVNFNASGTGYLVHCGNGTINFTNNEIYGFKAAIGDVLVRCGGGSLNNLNNTFYTDALAANCDWVSQAGGTHTIKNCIVRSTATPQILYYCGIGAPTVLYSCLNGVTSPPAGTGVITSDPQFVDEASGDLHLAQSSPCRGAGTYL